MGLIFRMVLAKVFQFETLSFSEVKSSIRLLFEPSVISYVSLMCFLSWSKVTVLELLKI